MEWNKHNTKSLLLVVCGGVAFYVGLQHLSAVTGALRALVDVLMPLLFGCALAFVLNVPMRAIERHLFPGNRRMKRLRRPLALVLTLVAVLLVVTLAYNVIGPGIKDAVLSIAAQVPDAIARMEAWIYSLEEYLPQIEALILDLDIDWKSLSQKAIDIVQHWGKDILSTGSGLIGSVVSIIGTFIIGLIFSLYILLQKEKLACQGRQVAYALLPERAADRLLYVLRLADKTFSSFLSGQCLEAVILGSIFVVAMTIFRMPYAVLVGVLIAITALIPIVGAFIGCIIGALLIAITDGWMAIWFVVMFLILQQIEGNLIYPHVVGSSVGLPSIWVLAAVTIGGSLFGILGMLLFIPLCSVLYALLRSFVKERLKQRRIPAEKWRNAP